MEDGPETDGGLWRLITAWVPPSELEELRRIIGEPAITRSDELRAEIGALEEILEQFQADNEARLEQSRQQQRSRVLRRLPAAPQRKLLEARVRLLLERVDSARASGGRARGAAAAPAVTVVSTPADRAVYEYLRPRDDDDDDGDGARGAARPGSASRGSGARPSSARSSNSDGTARPEDKLEQLADRLNAFDIDGVAEDVRAAFDDEHRALLAEVDELTSALEDEDNSLIASVASAAPSEVPSDSELRRFSSKLEDAWLAQEHQLETGAKLARAAAGGVGPLPTPPPESDATPARPHRPLVARDGPSGSSARPHKPCAGLKGGAPFGAKGGSALLQPLAAPPATLGDAPTFAASRAVLPPRAPRAAAGGVSDAPRRSDKLQQAMQQARDIEQQARDAIHLTELEGVSRTDLAALAMDSPAALALATPRLGSARPASGGTSRFEHRAGSADDGAALIADEAAKATLRDEMQVLASRIGATVGASDDERFLT